LLLATCTSTAFGAPKLEYNRDIRPILAENCFACHGADSAARKAKLRLDVRDDAIKAEAIVPGKPDKSGLIDRTHTDDVETIMPPVRTKKAMTAAQKATLKQWIVEGAEYQPHWAFIAPQKVALPTVKNAVWARTPIDFFILAELEKHGLTPAPEADRRTLARRLSLDLTGLPPEPAEVEAFVADTTPDAYEKYVDRLLKSPHWGEHRGRYWLDAARYADTHGIHFDNYREIWSYRDWVIRAFNNNMPFNQFTIEQLAGDLLPNATLDQKIASGFNRCNITTNEGGAIAEEYLVLYTRDRTETSSAVFLGLTAGCAVCHDHKFDPLAQREFYEMAAFFNNTTQNAMDGNIKDTPPILRVPAIADRPRYEAVTKELVVAQQAIAVRKTAAKVDFDKWLADAKPEQIGSVAPTDGLVFHAGLSEGQGKSLNFAIDGKDRKVETSADWIAGNFGGKVFQVKADTKVELSDVGDFDKTQPFTVGAWVRLPKANLTGAIIGRMDEASGFRGWDMWIDGNKPGMHFINTWPGDAVKVVGNTALQPNKWHHVLITYDGSMKASGIKIFVDGQPQPTTVQADVLKGTTKTNVPLKFGQRHTTGRLDGIGIQDLRIYTKTLTGPDALTLAKSSRTAALVAKKDRKPEEVNELFDWWLVSLDKSSNDLTANLARLQQEEAAIRARGTVAHVMQEKTEMAMAHILFRGDYDKRRDPVKPNTPRFLPPMASELPKNRIGYAQWLLQPDHPLMTRVTVNRFWQELFGTGIVRTSGDFGVTGDLPTHPELLDWMALEFRDKNWDVRAFFKMMVMSATYRQSAATTPLKNEKDAFNRYLSRGPRFRMDAEMIRDYALASSGLMTRKLGGPSVRPYQPDGVWEAVAMPGSDTRNYKRDQGENLYRRSMYTFWKRAAPPASMDILNAPNRETCAVRRDRTNTPLQALVTLNDPQFVEAARYLAQRAMKEGGESDDTRIDFISKRLLARSLRPEEVTIVRELLTDLRTHYKAKPDEAKLLVSFGDSKADATMDVPSLAAWTMVTNQLMNLDEVLNK